MTKFLFILLSLPWCADGILARVRSPSGVEPQLGQRRAQVAVRNDAPLERQEAIAAAEAALLVQPLLLQQWQRARPVARAARAS